VAHLQRIRTTGITASLPHFPLARELIYPSTVSDAIQNVIWREAEETAKEALQARIALWDGVLEEITTAHRVEEVHDSIACIP
jgi:hypothetical protein